MHTKEKLNKVTRSTARNAWVSWSDWQVCNMSYKSRGCCRVCRFVYSRQLFVHLYNVSFSSYLSTPSIHDLSEWQKTWYHQAPYLWLSLIQRSFTVIFVLSNLISLLKTIGYNSLVNILNCVFLFTANVHGLHKEPQVHVTKHHTVVQLHAAIAYWDVYIRPPLIFGYERQLAFHFCDSFSSYLYTANVHGLCKEHHVHIAKHLTIDRLHAAITYWDVCMRPHLIFGYERQLAIHLRDSFSSYLFTANVHGLCKEHQVHITKHVTVDHLHAAIAYWDVCMRPPLIFGCKRQLAIHLHDSFSSCLFTANVHGLREEHQVHIAKHVTVDHLHAAITFWDVCVKHPGDIPACLCLHQTVGYSPA